MIAEIGNFALMLALAVSLAQAGIPLVGAARRDAAWMALARPAALAQLLLVGVAFACLTHAYVVSDFTVANVVENSHSAKPMIYKVSGVWGNHEGSMVLWVLILALFGAAVAAFGGNLPPTLRARVIAVQGMIGLGFLAFILFTSNPFERVVPPPLDGDGLNPLLQDPGLAIHPPMLYLGYVGFSVAFSFAVAALIEGKVDAAWARWVRPWTLAAWCFLTAGIGLGSWWAYYELGWGGWWYWDPVENASFMPWLVGTALLHSAVVVEKRDALKSWTILLAILTFSLSLIGTFLVRSGVLTSVHAFAVDPSRGVFILALLVIAVGGSLALYAARAPALTPTGLFAPLSREGSLVLNNLLLVTATATVFLGTFYPLFIDVIGEDKVSVGPPFFNATFVPLMVPLIVAMAAGPLMSWKRADLAGVLGRLRVAIVLTVAVAVAVFWIGWRDSLGATLGVALAVWLLVGTVTDLADRLRLFRVPAADSLRRARGLPRAAWGMSLAHGGMAVLVAGITGISAWQAERIALMRPGESVDVAGFVFELESVEAAQGPNYRTQRGDFVVTTGDGAAPVRLASEKRFYPVRGMDTTEAGILSTAMYDIYVSLGEPDGRGAWSVRLYHNPLVPWLWAGVVLMVLGGGLSLTDRRHRVGAPRRAAADAAIAPPAPAE